MRKSEAGFSGLSEDLSSEAGLRHRYLLWLTEEGAIAKSIPVLLDGFLRFLNAEGFSIRRCNLATDTIHPQMSGLRHVWFHRAIDPGAVNPQVVVKRRQYLIGSAMIDEIFFNATNYDNPQYRASPFCRVDQDGELYDIVRPAGEIQPYPLFEDLLEQGCSAYFGMKLNSFGGMRQKIGLVTDLCGGLSIRQIDDLRWMLRLATLPLNTLVEYNIKTTLVRSYIGRDPGERVCEGMIELGRVVEIDAAIWFSDLRDFTAISDTLDAEALVEHLNAYFEQVVTPIYEHGGEVLKYVGDAILAIFPVANFASATEACNAALAAVFEAEARLQAMNAERSARGSVRLNHGVALHFGTAQYGNIGSLERLDFTLIGREVNIASRIEDLTKAHNEPLLVSEPFVNLCTAVARPIGSFKLRGIAVPTQVFAIER